MWEDAREIVLHLPYEWKIHITQPWVCSVTASIIIGIAGIIPIFIIPSDEKSPFHPNQGSKVLQLLLSFAVGGLLADVFLHLLPEAWSSALQVGLDPREAFSRVGLCVLLGIFVFIVVEVLAAVDYSPQPPSDLPSNALTPPSDLLSNALNGTACCVHAVGNGKNTRAHSHKSGKVHYGENEATLCLNGGKNGLSSNDAVHYAKNIVKLEVNCSSSVYCNDDMSKLLCSCAHSNNNSVNGHVHDAESYKERLCPCSLLVAEEEQEGNGRKSLNYELVGYLNLLANSIDNFAHGLAVAGSFMVSYRTGVLTTSAILMHEVPHEIGDFAILLSSGFTRWEAVKAQMYTAAIGLLGALVTLSLGTSSLVGCVQLYILGFSAGTFLNISLVSLLPQMMKEERPAHAAAQVLAILLGAITMAAATH